jgi:hypothetical protein
MMPKTIPRRLPMMGRQNPRIPKIKPAVAQPLVGLEG